MKRNQTLVKVFFNFSFHKYIAYTQIQDFCGSSFTVKLLFTKTQKLIPIELFAYNYGRILLLN